jgi:hypothetical protein
MLLLRIFLARSLTRVVTFVTYHHELNGCIFGIGACESQTPSHHTHLLAKSVPR